MPLCAPWVNLEVPINCVLLEHWNLYIFPFWGHASVCSMGKFGSPHKLCIIRTLEFVYFSFFGGACHCVHWNLYIFPMGKFGSPHKLCIIRTLEFVYFSFFGGMPCVLHG